MSIQLQKLSLKAKLFRGLGDSTRLSILELLREGEKTTSQIVTDTAQNQWLFYFRPSKITPESVQQEKDKRGITREDELRAETLP